MTKFERVQFLLIGGAASYVGCLSAEAAVQAEHLGEMEIFGGFIIMSLLLVIGGCAAICSAIITD